MDIEKELSNIDEQFSLLIQPKTKIDNYNTFKEIADVYLSKYKIPYTRDTSGSSIVYRCPFLETCTFCIRGAISRSKSPGKKGIMSIKSICLQHSCKWQEIPRDKRTTNYRPSYKNRPTYREKQNENAKQNDTTKSVLPNDNSLLPGVDIDYLASSVKPSLVESPDIPILSECLPSVSSKKRPYKQSDITHSKRPMYCRNAYMHYIVKQLVKRNPYISLRAILSILESNHVECKEVTVARSRSEERAKYITPMKDLIHSLQDIESQIHHIYPNDDIEIVKTVENGKEYLLSVYICPDISRTIFRASLQSLYLDCISLKNETGGNLYLAFTLDGGNKSILLAYMIAEEESHVYWRQFLEFLEKSQIVSPSCVDFNVIQSLICSTETILPTLTPIQPELSLPPISWYSSSSIRKKKSSNNRDYPSLRSIFFRIIFSSSTDTSILMEHFFSDNRDLYNEMSHHGKWNRRLFDQGHNSITECIIKDFELNVLDKHSIRYLMLDDVVTGLYTIQVESSRKRYMEYSSSESLSDYTPFYTSVLKEYENTNGEYTIQTQDNIHFVVNLVSNPMVSYSVDLLTHSCTCSLWQESHFPCIHAWKVIKMLQMPMEPLMKYFTCSSAMAMAPQCEVPPFKHVLAQQVDFFMHSEDVLVTKESSETGDSSINSSSGKTKKSFALYTCL